MINNCSSNFIGSNRMRYLSKDNQFNVIKNLSAGIRNLIVDEKIEITERYLTNLRPFKKLLKNIHYLFNKTIIFSVTLGNKILVIKNNVETC